jgi:hypothetical protein
MVTLLFLCHRNTSLGESLLLRSKVATNHKSGLIVHQLAAFLAEPRIVSQELLGGGPPTKVTRISHFF